MEVGAGTCIDRATTGETVIGRGTKIDNLVQIAHNVRVGPLSILCAQVGVSGSTDLGDRGGAGRPGGRGGPRHHRRRREGGVPSRAWPTTSSRARWSPAPRRWSTALWLRQSAALKQLPEAPEADPRPAGADRGAGVEEGRSRPMMDVLEIQKLLPHRYPFLLVDRVVSIEPAEVAQGLQERLGERAVLQRSLPRASSDAWGAGAGGAGAGERHPRLPEHRVRSRPRRSPT